MSDIQNRPRLGRGLEALIPKSLFTAGKTLTQLPIALIKPNPYQPRTEFDPEALQRLSDSIKQHGLTQPILVRKIDDHYELIAGERRFRASILANLDSIPAIVKMVSDKESLQLALIENLEREDLNVVEEAKGYLRLINEFDLTHQGLSEIFGKNRSTITNVLRLLNLPEEVLNALSNNIISEGHARSLLSLENETAILEAFQQIQLDGLNVRQVEALVSQKKMAKKSKIKPVRPYIEFEKHLAEKFNTRVKIQGTSSKGKVEIKYHSAEQLRRLYDIIGN